jgi:hypothetical protein
MKVAAWGRGDVGGEKKHKRLFDVQSKCPYT